GPAELLLDDCDALGRRPLPVVVLDDVVEAPGKLLLLPRERDPLAHLARALGRALLQPSLELVEWRIDEERHRSRHLLLHRRRAVQLELEQGNAALVRDPVELRAKRAGFLTPGEDVVLEELAVREAAIELLLGQEPVVHA